MKNKPVLALLICAAALALLGAKGSGTAYPVEIGGSYVITTGLHGVKGRIASDLGGGWFMLEQADGRGPIAVNLGAALTVAKVTK